MLQAAILRVLIDLIKADSIIESNEMDTFNSVLSEYRINNVHLKKAAAITLSQATEILQSSEIYQQDRNVLLKHLDDIALVDGSCMKDEALILTAMNYCLSRDSKVRSEIISVNIPNIDITKGQVLYIESEKNESYHNEIVQNYRQLAAEFKCAGLNLLYLPKMTANISNTDPVLFKNICHFLAPDLNEEELDEMITYIKNVTTAQFCKDLLFGKLFMSSVVNNKPGLLLHIGASQIEGEKYDNFGSPVKPRV